MAGQQTHAWMELRRLNREIRSLYQKTAEQAGLAESEFEILRTVWELGGGCSQSDICRYIFLKKQTVNSAVRKLEQDCLLKPNEREGRAIPLSLTAKGRHLAESIVAPIITMENEVFMRFSSIERANLLRLTQKYISCLRVQVAEMGHTNDVLGMR